MNDELKRLAEELAEEYVEDPAHDADPYCDYGYGHPMLKGFLAGFTACAERMGGERDQLQSKLAIYEDALYDIISEPPNSMGDHAGIAREALEKGKG